MSWLDNATVVRLECNTDMRRIVPFIDREMQGYGDRYCEELTWYDFTEFKANMRFCSISKGRSSVKFHVEDEDGIKYEIFMKDAPVFIYKATRGCLEGHWGFIKRIGSNYGVQYLGEEETE